MPLSSPDPFNGTYAHTHQLCGCNASTEEILHSTRRRKGDTLARSNEAVAWKASTDREHVDE